MGTKRWGREGRRGQRREPALRWAAAAAASAVERFGMTAAHSKILEGHMESAGMADGCTGRLRRVEELVKPEAGSCMAELHDAADCCGGSCWGPGLCWGQSRRGSSAAGAGLRSSPQTPDTWMGRSAPDLNGEDQSHYGLKKQRQLVNHKRKS